MDLRDVKLRTSCHSCVFKCCSRPDDFVYLTPSEVTRLHEATGRPPEAFVTQLTNRHSGEHFTVLALPCTFLHSKTGQCQVYDQRPLMCKLYPFYMDALSGAIILEGALCKEHLDILPPSSPQGWNLDEHRAEIEAWLSEFWAKGGNEVEGKGHHG